MQSMTGMGRSRLKTKNGYLCCEMKSVNHRYCEVSYRSHHKFQFLETDVVAQIKKTLSRGRVDVWVGYEKEAVQFSYDEEAFKQHHQLLKKIKKDFKIDEPLRVSDFLNHKEMIFSSKTDEGKVKDDILEVVELALKQLLKMRSVEGKNLQDVIESRLERLAVLRSLIVEKVPVVIEEQKTKLSGRIEKLLGQTELDPARLAQEVAYITDRMDISEELDRLKAHFDHVQDYLGKKENVGRSLDFLVQEMNREFNTIASKSSSASISHWVVEAKSELEKLREQIQNIE